MKLWRMRHAPPVDRGRPAAPRIGRPAMEVSEQVDQIAAHGRVPVRQIDGHLAAVVVQQGVGSIAEQGAHSLPATTLNGCNGKGIVRYGTTVPVHLFINLKW